MTMTVGELREALESFSDDQPIILAMQPSYPMDYTLAGVVTRADIDLSDDLEDDEEPEDETGPEPVYLVEGGQIGYGLRAVHNAV